jgi:hypothetical protein
MNRSSMRFWRNVVYLLLVAAALLLVVVWWQELRSIWAQHWLTFLGATGLMTLGAVVQAHNFIAFLGVSLPRAAFTRIWALSALSNYVAPLQPGIALRIVYLKSRGVSVRQGLLAIGGLGGGLLLTGDLRGRWPGLVLLLAWVAILPFRQLLIASLFRLQRPAWLLRHRELLRDAANMISATAVAGVALQYLLGTVLLYWVYTSFGAPIGIGQALVLACVVYLASVVAIVPGNFGFLEMLYLLGGHGLGLPLSGSVALALLLRVSHVAANMLLALIPARDDG